MRRCGTSLTASSLSKMGVHMGGHLLGKVGDDQSNIFGPEGLWRDGREKASTASYRKVAKAENDGEMEMWGDGEQTRSFLYIDECLEGFLFKYRYMVIYTSSIFEVNK